jgi:hypothetical protein
LESVSEIENRRKFFYMYLVLDGVFTGVFFYFDFGTSERTRAGKMQQQQQFCLWYTFFTSLLLLLHPADVRYTPAAITIFYLPMKFPRYSSLH